MDCNTKFLSARLKKKMLKEQTKKLSTSKAEIIWNFLIFKQRQDVFVSCASGQHWAGLQLKNL